MLPDRRRDEIIRLLTQRGDITLRELAAALGVSQATARRDIARLADLGLLARVYGGAVIKGPNEAPFSYSDSTDRDQKRRIAVAAAELVNDSDTVILDIGSTVLELSRMLAGRPITVITSNLAAFEVLMGAAPTEVVLLGGQVRRNYLSTVGFLTELSLAALHADIAFLGTSGVTLEGRILDTTPIEVPVKRQAIRSADKVALLATERKFPGRGIGVACEASDIAYLVTSRGIPDQFLQPFRDAGTRIVEVDA